MPLTLLINRKLKIRILLCLYGLNQTTLNTSDACRAFSSSFIEALNGLPEVVILPSALSLIARSKSDYSLCVRNAESVA